MPNLFIPSGILIGATELVQSYGQDPESLARRCQLPILALRDPDFLVSARAVMIFFEQAAAACKDRGFGLVLADQTRLAAILGPLWILLRTARSIDEMCGNLAENFDLYSSAATMSFERNEGGGLLSWGANTGQAESEVQMAEFAMATCCQEIRSHHPPGWQPSYVQFRHAPPAQLSRHHRMFGSQLRFNQDVNAIGLDKQTLQQPMHSRSVGARSLVRSVLRHDMALLDAGLSARVESIIRALLPFAPCTVGDVSGALGMAERTLQEHLQARNSSFKIIKDKVRADLAMKYVAHSELSLTEITDILGYSDLSTFSRSFRRWHGTSARDIRRQ